ncbi:hypothetical protein [Dehalogenimonas etheniformans]|uniref:Uncharacterized protein n=1 Tax=Dehalogenimonas etheniformans TaxID=1536648 RepID=A0A2P5P601_9CHLR|nr:hypothetical protein [Dehalogenimonas etheniformans]PPD57722.1 hypothetical protein JP09_008250 [Dehalogenimonas etheniformans]QNT76062.1 hypothetical protein HX448_04825 [Dehalogenimonas etheniformans]
MTVYAEKAIDTMHGPYGDGQLAEIGFRYTSGTYARCPICGGAAFVTRQEYGPQAIFRCSSCFHQFEPSGKTVLWV